VNERVRLMERRRVETLHTQLAKRLVIRESTAPPPTGAAEG
jgi:hypothetical protein